MTEDNGLIKKREALKEQINQGNAYCPTVSGYQTKL
jgi:hypothetical protein